MRRFREWVLIGVALALIAVLGPPALAQSSTGVVTGTVKDASGAIVPGVEVTITDTATNAKRVVVTEDNGRFRLTSIEAGNYRAEARLAGFKTSVTSFKLDVAGVATLNFILEVGEVSTVAEVTDIAQKVNTEEGTLSSVVNERQVKELPLNGRNVFQLALLQPGVTQGVSDGINTGGAEFNASGNRARGNNFSLDGAGNNDPITGGAVQLTPNLDTIAEFRIQNNNFSAEYGRDNGAVVNVITKSGTNQFHGTAYWFHRNDALDAREIFDATDIAPLRQHQAGFTVGGPVIRDKTFFFFGYEAFRAFTGESSVSTYETQAFRDQVHALYPGSIQDTLFQAFPGPTPQTDLVDVGSISGAFESPGAPDGILDKGLVSAFAPNVTKTYQYNIRVDHEIGQNDKFYGRYTWEDQSQPGNDLRSEVFATDFEGFAAQGVLSETHIFSPTVVNEFRYGYSRNTSDFVSDTRYTDINIDPNEGGGISGFGAYGGVPQYFTGEEYHLVDVVSVNRGNHGVKVGFEYRWNQDDSDFQFLTNGYVEYYGMFDFAANLPYYQGFRVDPRQTSGTPNLVGTPHNFRQQELGFFVQDDWKVSDRLTLNLGIRYDNYGLLKDTQDRLANIILGQGRDVFERVANATVGQVPPEGIFARDNNNWAPRLGFAWDIFGNGKTSLRGGFGVAYDRLFLNVSGNVRFNPPFSANLGLFPDGLEGDLGISPEAISRLIATGVQIPFQVPNGLVSAGFNPGGGPQLQFTVPGQGTADLSGRISLRSPDPNLKTSYSMNWFLGIQRELPWDMVFEVNYVGNGGRKLGFIEVYNRFSGDRFGFPDPYNGDFAGDNGANRLNPYFNAENFRTNNVNSSYHGGNVSLQKRFSQGLTFQSAFTFGKVIDYASDNFGSNSGDIVSPNPGRLDLERGLASFDIPKRWVSNFIYEIPFMKDQQGVLGQVLGGWQIQGILTLQNGSPYTVQAYSTAHDYNGDYTTGDRPDAPANTSQYNNLSRQQYINGVFGSTPAVARGAFNPNGIPCERGSTRTSCSSSAGGPRVIGIGTEGRGLFRGPGFANADFSLFKNFRLPWVGQEDSKLQFRAEFFNIFNRPNLNNVNRSFTSSTFGRSTSAQDAREIQFALKFIF